MNNVDTVQTFFDRLSSADFVAAVELFTDDVILEWPYQLDGRPPTRIGPDAHQGVLGVGSRYSKMGFVDVIFHDAPASDVVVAEYRGEFMTAEGRPYLNRYVGVFELRDGRNCSLAGVLQSSDPRCCLRPKYVILG